MLSRFCTTALIFSLASGVMFSTSHAAKIYHWVDDQGRSHYSENLPHNIQAKKLNIKTTGVGSAGSSSSPTEKTPEKSTSANSDEKKSLTAEHSPEDKAKYCQQSRELLQNMNGNTQRRFEQPDGSFRKLEAAEIADYKAQAQAGIKNFCQ